MPLVIRGNILQTKGRVDWLPDGNATQPSLTFATDPDTGLYRAGPNDLAFTVGGTDRLRIDAAGTTVTGNANITGDTEIDGNATVTGEQATLTLAPSGTAQYDGSSLRLLNNAHPSTRKGISLGSVIRDPDGNNTIFTVDVLDSSNVVTTTPLMYDLNDDRWYMHGFTTLTGTLHVSDYYSNVTISSTNTAQYTGPKLIFVNNATQPTRRNTSLGTFIRDSDGTDSYFAIDALDDTQSYLATMARYDLTDHRWSFLTQNLERLVIEPVGDVSVTGNLNTSGTVIASTLSGNLNASRITSDTGNVDVTGNLFASGQIVAFSSDERLKANITPIHGALDAFEYLDGYSFTWRNDIPGLPMRGGDIGLVAQDLVRAGYDDCVSLAPFDTDSTTGMSKSGQTYLTVHYNKVHAISIAAIKELKAIVDAQKVQLDEQERRIRALEARHT